MPYQPSADDHPSIDHFVHAALRPVAAALSGLYFVFSLSHALLLSGSQAMLLSALALATCLICALIAWRAPRLAPGWAHPLAAALSGLVLLNSVIHLALSHTPRQSTNLALLMVGAGCFLLSLRWLAVVIGASWCAWLAIALTQRQPDLLPAWQHFGFMLATATLIAILAARERIRALTRLEQLRRADQQHLRQVEQTLQALHSSEERFRALVHNATDMITVLDPDGTIRFESPSVERILGYSPSSLIGTKALSLIHPRDRHAAQASFAQIVQAPDASFTLEYRFRHANGEWIYLESRGTNLLDHPAIGGIVINSRDITERKRVEEALLEREHQLRQVIETINAIPWELDLTSGRFTYVGPQSLAMLGYSPQEWTDLDFWTGLIHPDDRAAALRTCQIATQRGEDHAFEYRMLTADGRELWVRDIVTVVKDIDGPRALRGVIVDITERRLAEQQLEQRAWRDELTGLANRAALLQHLEQRLERARHAPHDSFAVLFLDLDNFKQINDTLGHLVGDRLLQLVGQRLSQQIRPTDLAARLGGDEFVIVVQQIAGPHEAPAIAERLLAALCQPFTLDGQILKVTPSIGVALADGSTPQVLDVLRDADIALYRAKAQGKACYALFQPSAEALP